MADRATLKTYFQTGDTPTQSQFEELIDSLALKDEVSVVPFAHASSGTITLSFDKNKMYQDVQQTGAITWVLGSGNIRNNINELSIIGDDISPLNIPEGFISGNGVEFDPTKINDIFLKYKSPTRIIYNIITSEKP